jgi:pilus assembly protein TadC
MNKEIWYSTPGLILIAVLLFLVLSVLGHLFGATYFTMATITVGFLLLLILYLCLHIFEAKLLKKIRKRLTKNGD